MTSKVKQAGCAAVGCCGNFCSGFKDFILRGNVVDLAVAVVVGAAFKDLINSFVASFITPLLGMIGSSESTSKLSFTVNGSTFNYGLFITQCISFVIICFVVYTCIVLPLMGLMNRLFPLRTCPECMQIDVPANALRCKYCCSTLEPVMRKSKSGGHMENIATSPPPAVGMSTGGVHTTGTTGTAPAGTAAAMAAI